MMANLGEVRNRKISTQQQRGGEGERYEGRGRGRESLARHIGTRTKRGRER